MTTHSVYIIKCKDDKIPEIYIGSSVNLPNRINRHHSAYEEFPNRKVYKFIRENGGWDNWKFEVIETLNENDDVLKIERNYIEDNVKNLNQAKPYLTQDEKNNYHKRWKEKNKLRCLMYRKKYQAMTITCECGRTVKRNNLSTHKKTKVHKNKMSLLNINNERPV